MAITFGKAVLATAMLSTGLLGSTGLAVADTHGSDAHGATGHSRTQSKDDGSTHQRGVVNSEKVAPNTSPDACSNDLQSNVLGVQVPFQETAPAASILSGSDGSDRADNGSISPGSDRGCSSPASS